MYELFMTKDAHRFYEEADPVLVRKLNRCFETLRDDPYRHPNVKRLKGPLAGYLRYRIGERQPTQPSNLPTSNVQPQRLEFAVKCGYLEAAVGRELCATYDRIPTASRADSSR